MAAKRQLLKITDTRPNLETEYFLFHFERELGYNVDNVYPGYDRHADVLAAMHRYPAVSVNPMSTDWGQEDGHHDHSVEGVSCEDEGICICGPMFTSFTDDNLSFSTNIKMSEAFPIVLEETNPIYEMRKAYNDKHGIVETVEVLSVDDHWKVL